MSYDVARRPVTVTDPAGLTTTTAYDPDGRVVAITRAAGGLSVTSRRSYTASGQLARATDANGNTTTTAYDAADRVASVTDAVGRVTSFSYDAAGRLATTGNLAIQAQPLESRSYAPDGQLASLTDARGNVTRYAYDGFGRLSTTTHPGGATEQRSYDNDDNLLTRTTRDGRTIAFAYDALNRLTSKTPPAPAPVVSYGYDLAGRQIAVNDNSAAIARPLPPGGAGTVQYGQTTSYDALNRPVLVGFSPAPAQVPPAAAASVTFGHSYDATNRRKGQTTSDTGWWSVPGAAGTVAYSVNALNQYTAVGAVTPAYDANGNLTFDGTFTYGYDAENRLVSASGPGLTASYAYDAAGHRKSKTVNGTTTILVGDGSGPDLLEYDGATGQLLARTIPGPGANEALSRLDLVAGSRTTLVPDIQGSILARLDSATGALTRQGYRPFGETPGSSVFGYTGQRLDAETGLLDYHARAYLAAWGRFVQPDPLGSAGGRHLYAYVGNDPLNATDPTGMVQDAAVSSVQPYADAYQNFVVAPLRTGLTALAQSPAGDPGLYASLQGMGPAGALAAGVGETLAAGLRAYTGVGRAAEEVAPFSTYNTSITSPGSQYLNVQTNVTAQEFQSNLSSNGYSVVKQTAGTNGPVTILNNGGSTYTTYTRTSTGASGAQYVGPDGASIKFSLGVQ